eukprot:8174973-Lingulodinium_polyedra.AAC.1
MRVHGFRREAAAWARGAVCLACGRNYHLRARLSQHLHGSEGCLAAYKGAAFLAPLTAEEALALDRVPEE